MLKKQLNRLKKLAVRPSQIVSIKTKQINLSRYQMFNTCTLLFAAELFELS